MTKVIATIPSGAALLRSHLRLSATKIPIRPSLCIYDLRLAGHYDVRDYL